MYTTYIDHPYKSNKTQVRSQKRAFLFLRMLLLLTLLDFLQTIYLKEKRTREGPMTQHVL